MTPFRTFTFLFLGAFLAFVAANIVVWELWTKELLTSTCGDLARLGYYYDARLPRRDVIDLPRRHLEFKEYHGQPVDIVTIGDSFSQGGGGGLNRYYQDYIASINNLTVLNICLEGNQDPVATLVKLINNGYLRRIRPRIVLLEVVERTCAAYLGKGLDYGADEGVDSFIARASKDYYTMVPPRISPVNSGNAKFVFYAVCYRFMESPTGQVRVKPLTTPLFSARASNKLLFLRTESDSARHLRPLDVEEINGNLNRLGRMLADQGIRFWFMPVVDKSDLYRDYVRDTSSPRSIFFDELRRLPKQYGFIDTKALLAPELARGEKDVFYADETHWSRKASRKIFTVTGFGEGVSR
jgi:hypothetical protein